jgi:GNAT superfamily N-acetyltransferase
VFRLLRRFGLFSFRVQVRRLDARPLPLPEGVAIGIIPAHEASRFSSPGLEVDEHKAAAAFARGEVCVGALHEDRLVGYAWFALAAAPHVDGVWMDFNRSAVYTYRAFVKVEFRGRGIASALYRFADARFIAAGRRFAILCIDSANRSSLAAARKSGARSAGRAGYWQAFGRFIGFRSTGAAGAGFRFFLPGARFKGEPASA